MKKGLPITEVLTRLQRMAPDMGGVLSYADMSCLIGSGDRQYNRRLINRLCTESQLCKIARGWYTASSPDLTRLVCRMFPQAYVSMDSALAIHGLIGTVPHRSVSAVVPGRRRMTRSTPAGLLRIFSIAILPTDGIVTTSTGVRLATPERAWLDLLFYYTKGARFVIDPLNEVDCTQLDRSVVTRYLADYANPKFRSFVKGQLDAQRH